MKVSVNPEKCIGCGSCQAICDDVFEIGDEGLAEVINDDIKEFLYDDVKDAAENCPTDAIEIEE